MCSWKSRIRTQSDRMPVANAERSMPNTQCPMQSCPLAPAPAQFTGCHPKRSEGSHIDSRRRFGMVCMINRLTRGLSSSVRLGMTRSEEHTSELQSRENLVCRLLLEKKKYYICC